MISQQYILGIMAGLLLAIVISLATILILNLRNKRLTKEIIYLSDLQKLQDEVSKWIGVTFGDDENIIQPMLRTLNRIVDEIKDNPYDREGYGKLMIFFLATLRTASINTGELLHDARTVLEFSVSHKWVINKNGISA
jgi:hypothetical protein